MLFHNHGVFQRFVDELRQTYGDVETLNEAWGLVYWSHRLSTWADLWTPDGNCQPQYDLAWRTFQAKLTTEFIAWQADIVREYARDDQFVTTCIAYERPAVDDANLTRALDVTAGNPYYAMQDALAVPEHGAPRRRAGRPPGPGALFLSADRMYASKQAPFLVTETNAGAIGGSATNFPAYDGQWRQAAWAFVARGARDDRVLALAHQPLRHRDVLGRHPAARPAAGSGLPRAQPARRRLPARRVAGRRAAARRPGRAALLGAVQVGPGLPGGFPQPGAGVRRRRSPTWTSARTTGSSKPSTAGRSRPGVPGADHPRRASSSAPTATGSTRPTVAADLPVLIVPGLLVADDALLDLAPGLRRGGRPPRDRAADRRTATPKGRARTEVKPGPSRRGRRRPLPGVLQPRGEPAAGDRRERRLRSCPTAPRPPTGSTG